jgi:hypothetical protein
LVISSYRYYFFIFLIILFYFPGEDICLILCEPSVAEIAGLLSNLSALSSKDMPANILTLALNCLQPNTGPPPATPTWHVVDTPSDPLLTVIKADPVDVADSVSSLWCSKDDLVSSDDFLMAKAFLDGNSGGKNPRKRKSSSGGDKSRSCSDSKKLKQVVRKKNSNRNAKSPSAKRASSRAGSLSTETDSGSCRRLKQSDCKAEAESECDDQEANRANVGVNATTNSPRTKMKKEAEESPPLVVKGNLQNYPDEMV